jgi:hypothetical protein
MIHEIQKPFPVSTPRGRGFAHFLVDHGKENHNEWICFMDTGQIWSFLNKDIALESNPTYGRIHEEI